MYGSFANGPYVAPNIFAPSISKRTFHPTVARKFFTLTRHPIRETEYPWMNNTAVLPAHGRKNIRLPGYDYSGPGNYFVTICTKYRIPLFGDVINGRMELNRYGHIVRREIHRFRRQYAYARIDSYVVMPDHCHIIVRYRDDAGRSTPTIRPQRKILGRFIAAIKTTAAKAIHQCRGGSRICTGRSRTARTSPVWQRNYHERIIRNEEELSFNRMYIRDNPKNW